MEKFYHLYFAINNLEQVELTVEAQQLAKLDQNLHKILQQAKVDPPQNVLDKILQKAYSLSQTE